MPTGVITISQYACSPPVQLSVNSLLEVRGFYDRDYVSIDGVSPVLGNSTNGEQGPYYSTTPTLDSSNNLVVPAHDVQITVGANPTANYFEGLWVDGAFVMWLMPNTQGATGWQIPSVYGDPIAFDEIATYNRARRLVYPPDSYFTADETIQEIERIAGQFAYAAVDVNGITSMSWPPEVASLPIAESQNDPRIASYLSITNYGARTSNTAAQNTTAIGLAVTAAAAVGAGIYWPTGYFPVNNITISVPCQFAANGGPRPATGQTVTFTKAMSLDASKHFDNALSGQGTVVLPSWVEAIPEWWGTNTTPGTTVVTTFVNAALASGAATIRLDSNYRVGLLTVSSSVHRIYGIGTLTQNAAGANVLAGTGLSNIVFEGITIVGVSGDALESANSGIVVTTSSHVKVRDCTLQNLRYYAFEAINSSDIHFEVNDIIGGSTGIQLSGVTDAWIDNNDFGVPQYSGFCVGVKLDSGATTPNLNIQIKGNKLQDWTYAQAILVHNGNGVVIDDNIMNNVLSGISLNPFDVTGPDVDVVNNITIGDGNQYVGPDTSLAPSGFQNTGLTIAGAAGSHVTNVVVNGGIWQNANVVGDLFSQGGIAIGYADNVIIDGVLIIDCVAAGIALNNPTTGLVIQDFNIKNVVPASDTSSNGIVTTALSPHVGRIQDGRIDDATFGMRFGVASPNLLIGPNDFLNIGSANYNGATNVSIQTDFDGVVTAGVTAALATTTPLDITSTLATGNITPYTPTQNSTLNATSVPTSGQQWTLIVTTSGVSSFNITFGTHFKSQGVLATGTSSGKVFTVQFESDGVNLNETSRTIAM